jgi:hypothetical protein
LSCIDSKPIKAADGLHYCDEDENPGVEHCYHIKNDNKECLKCKKGYGLYAPDLSKPHEKICKKLTIEHCVHGNFMRSEDKGEDCDVCTTNWYPVFNPKNNHSDKCLPVTPNLRIANCELYQLSNNGSKPVCFTCKKGYYSYDEGKKCESSDTGMGCNTDADNRDGTCSMCNLERGYYSLGIKDMDATKQKCAKLRDFQANAVVIIFCFAAIFALFAIVYLFIQKENIKNAELIKLQTWNRGSDATTTRGSSARPSGSTFKEDELSNKNHLTQGFNIIPKGTQLDTIEEESFTQPLMVTMTTSSDEITADLSIMNTHKYGNDLDEEEEKRL